MLGEVAHEDVKDVRIQGKLHSCLIYNFIHYS